MTISFQSFTFLYIIFLVAGAIERVKYTFFTSNAKKVGHVYYRWTFIALFSIYILIVSSSVAEYFLIIKTVNAFISMSGFIIFLVGVLLRRISGKNLGRNWSFHVEIKENHELITTGIYKYLKHPYYLGVILELSGVCMISNSFYSLLLVFFVQLPLLAVRIFLEEKTLVSRFGDKYERYRFGKTVF